MAIPDSWRGSGFLGGAAFIGSARVQPDSIQPPRLFVTLCVFRGHCSR